MVGLAALDDLGIDDALVGKAVRARAIRVDVVGRLHDRIAAGHQHATVKHVDAVVRNLRYVGLVGIFRGQCIQHAAARGREGFLEQDDVIALQVLRQLAQALVDQRGHQRQGVDVVAQHLQLVGAGNGLGHRLVVNGVVEVVITTGVLGLEGGFRCARSVGGVVAVHVAVGEPRRAEARAAGAVLDVAARPGAGHGLLHHHGRTAGGHLGVEVVGVAALHAPVAVHAQHTLGFVRADAGGFLRPLATVHQRTRAVVAHGDADGLRRGVGDEDVGIGAGRTGGHGAGQEGGAHQGLLQCTHVIPHCRLVVVVDAP